MEILRAVVLGIVQGITEFFPVSSSGHLVIIPFFFKWDYVPVYYTVLVHFATLLALVTVFYREIGRIIKFFFIGLFDNKSRKSRYFNLALFIVIASIPAALAAYFLNDFIEGFFSKPFYVACFLLVTAAFLFTGELAGKNHERRKPGNNQQNDVAKNFEKILTAGDEINDEGKEKIKSLSYITALVIGIGQAIALFPGISRSGSTISFARAFGIKRQECVKFSMLLSIPVIFGSFIFSFFDSYKELATLQAPAYLNMAISFLFSYLGGLFAIKFLVRISRNRNFNFFAVYCVLLSIAVFILIFIRK